MDIAQDGNLFPREDILEAVAQSDWRDQPVRPWAWALATLGAFLITLGWPIVDPLTASTVTHSAAHPHGLLHPLHALSAWLGPASGLGIEFTWYVLSSMCLALSIPAMGLAGRSLGIGARLGFTLALVAALTPELLAHGRLPSDFPAGVLGTTVLLALTLAPSDADASGARGFGLRVAAALGLATLLHPWSLVAAPAVAFAAWRRGAWVSALPVLASAALLAAGLYAFGSSPGTASAAGSRVALLVPAVGSFVAVLPIAWVHSAEESPPPAWITLWFVSAVIGTVGATLYTPGLSTLPMLLPVLVLLAAGALARLARPDNAFRFVLMIAALQLVMLGVSGWTRPADRSPGLGAAGQELFRDGDVVYVPAGRDAATVAYLVRRRFNVEVVEGSLSAPPQDASADSAGRDIGVGHNARWTAFALDPVAGTVSPRE